MTNDDEMKSQHDGEAGGTLLGAPSRRGPMNVFPLWKYTLIGLICLLGAIYAAPNVFQPDPAVQIRSLDSDEAVGVAQRAQVAAALSDANIGVKAMEDEGNSLLIRLANESDQLGARALIADALNASSVNFVVALAQAPTTPQWLQDLGGKPMSLGLDLFGGAHFLLQVNMDDYIAGVVDNSAEGMRDALIDQRIRFIPNRDWIDGRTITISFRDDETRSAAREALAEYQDFLVQEREAGGNLILRFTLTDEKIRALEDRAISQNLTSLRNRVNELGVSEPQVQRLGGRELLWICRESKTVLGRRRFSTNLRTWNSAWKRCRGRVSRKLKATTIKAVCKTSCAATL